MRRKGAQRQLTNLHHLHFPRRQVRLMANDVVHRLAVFQTDDSLSSPIIYTGYRSLWVLSVES
jgi:hypothetical protein